MTQSIATTTAAPQGALAYLDRAVKALTPLGLFKPDVATASNAPIVALAAELQPIDESRALVVAKTLQHSVVFNEAVRSQVADMSIGSRHEAITQRFDSILEDSKEMLAQIEQNRNGWREKMGRLAMKLTRGSINTRFGRIKELYLEVSRDTKAQLDREAAILNAYLDYRGALKEAEISAAQMFKTQTERLEQARVALVAAQSEVDALAADTDSEVKARAQLRRDEVERTFSAETRRFDLIKTLSEQLSIQYSVGDTVMANLNQTRQVKQSLYDKGVAFFPTADTILASLDANLTSAAGLNEARRAIDATSAGLNRGLETLAEVSKTVKLDALKTAHGSTIKADSVKRLIDSMVTFQAESIKVVAELRAESERNTVQIGQIVEEGKEQFVRLSTAAISKA